MAYAEDLLPFKSAQDLPILVSDTLLHLTSIFVHFWVALAVWKAIQPNKSVGLLLLLLFPNFKAVLLIERAFYARLSSRSAADLCFSGVVHNADWWISERYGGK